MVTNIPMLIKINAQKKVRIVLKMRLSGWRALHVTNRFRRHVFVFRMFVDFFKIFLSDGKCKLFLIYFV